MAKVSFVTETEKLSLPRIGKEVIVSRTMAISKNGAIKTTATAVRRA